MLKYIKEGSDVMRTKFFRRGDPTRFKFFDSYYTNGSEFGLDEITRIKQLRAELHAHNHRYYIENAPTISDQDFDFLMHELQELEARHPELADPTSPTQRVGSNIQKEFRQVEHRYPMLSLANTYNEQDVAEWYQSVSRSLGGEPFQVCCEMKYDGLSISLTYKNGRLEQAVTRGDGVRGDDVTIGEIEFG
jgi:DNA ligase (NAD+)